MDHVPASRLQLAPGPWATLIDGLCARYPAIARDVWLDRFRRGRVTDAAGRALHPDAAYRAGLELRYFREVADEPRIRAEEAVLHVDAHLVVADKPHFLPVTPSGRFVRECLLARLIARLGNPGLVPLHRIDRDTAGLVLFSASAGSRDIYQRLFREREITKTYEAIAPPLPSVEFPRTRATRLERGDPFFRMSEVPGEANSTTRIEVLERGESWWRYALTPITGRKHQLRVHMAALGAPLRNDRWYPALSTGSADDEARPLQLLARSLTFVDPLDGARRSFVSARQLQSLSQESGVP